MSQIPLNRISGAPSLETVLSDPNFFRVSSAGSGSFGDHLQQARAPASGPDYPDLADSGPVEPEPLPADAPMPVAEEDPVRDHDVAEVPPERDSLDEASAEEVPAAETVEDRASETESNSGEHAQEQTGASEPADAAEDDSPTEAEEPTEEDGGGDAQPVVNPGLQIEGPVENRAGNANPDEQPGDTGVVDRQPGERATGDRQPGDRQPGDRATGDRGLGSGAPRQHLAAKEPTVAAGDQEKTEDDGQPPSTKTTLQAQQPDGDEAREAEQSASNQRSPAEPLTKEVPIIDSRQESSEEPSHREADDTAEKAAGGKPDAARADEVVDPLDDRKPSDRQIVPTNQSAATQPSDTTQQGQADEQAPPADSEVPRENRALPPDDRTIPSNQQQESQADSPEPDEPATEPPVPPRRKRGRRTTARHADSSVQPATQRAASVAAPSNAAVNVPSDMGVGAPDSVAKKEPVAVQGETTAVRGDPATPIRTAADPQRPADSTRPTQQTSEPGQVDRVRFVQRVARAFQAIGNRNASVRLRLSPPELGSLRLEISVRQGLMAARIEAETATARNLLLDNLPALRDRLAQQDIKIEQFQIDLSDGSQGGPPDRTGDQAESHKHDNRNSRATQPVGLGDENTEDSRESRLVNRPGEGTRLNIII